MGNPVKGEVAFEVEGKAYKLVLDFNALCEVEDALNGPLEIRGPLGIRAVIYGALRRNHPDLTLMDVGDLIETMGMDKAATLAKEAMTRSGLMGGDGKAPANPRQARRAAASTSRKR